MNIVFKGIFALLLCLNSAYGAGAAGTISVRNETDETVKVTYSGLGCDGYAYGIGSVCAYGILKPRQISHHDYGWGVTLTWINIGGDGLRKPAIACGLRTDTESYKRYCYIDHHTVNTDAHKTDACVLTEPTKDVFALKCNRK